MKIKLTIDRIEGETAVLKNDLGNTINWPLTALPEDARESNVFSFTIQDEKQSETENKENAKNILNELLETSE